MNTKELREKYNNTSYLGDGLYVKFDGYQIILTTERENGTHWVALEPKVFENLLLYQQELYSEIEKIKDLK